MGKYVSPPADLIKKKERNAIDDPFFLRRGGGGFDSVDWSLTK